jgi:hypothetical protein
MPDRHKQVLHETVLSVLNEGFMLDCLGRSCICGKNVERAGIRATGNHMLLSLFGLLQSSITGYKLVGFNGGLSIRTSVIRRLA